MSQSTLDHPIDTNTDDRLDALERELETAKISRDTWTMAVLGLSIAIALASVVGIGWALRAAHDDNGAAAVDGGTITAALTEYGIALSESEIGPNGHITVTNNGTMAHDLGVRDTDLMTASIAPGASATLDLAGLDPGTYELYCDVAGHADSGMKARLVIDESITAGGASGDAAAMGMTPAEHASMTASEGSQMDQAMTESILAFPAETAGEGNQPLSPTILPDGTKRFELTASVIDWEVTPGKTVQAWAYNGMVPGPRIDLEVGDRVEVQVTNELPVGTDIHWHGIDVPSGQDGVAPLTQDLIATGQTYTYSFTATEAAIGMYHAHAHAEQGVPNGLFGTLYVGHLPLPAGQTISGLPIPSDLVIAEDIPMVLNDAGAIGLSLNGKGFPATAPLVLDQGDWVRVTYFNEGLQVHPMHLHGFEQIVIAKDGEPLDHPYAADTILVAPGERYTVLFNATDVGTWVWHCHILNHVESEAGMFGMVTAVVVE